MTAITSFVEKKTDFHGATKVVWGDVTFSAAYAAGGDSFTLAQLGFSTIHGITPCGAAVGSATTGYEVMPDLVNLKLRLLSMGGVASTATALTETSTGDQHLTVARIKIEGNMPYV